LMRYWYLRLAVFLGALAVPALLLLAVGVGLLRPELHAPAWLWQFVLANLFFVSLAEEALFRGYLQQRLGQWLGPWPALALASALFGLAHFAGGPLLMLFAGLAGLIYGLAWLWSGRLWVATLFHFGLNLTHLLLFTYPLYRPA
ncbi:CPBP family intramembrane glutamic endopeptidase, partial [Pseudomonas aeruginosa]